MKKVACIFLSAAVFAAAHSQSVLDTIGNTPVQIDVILDNTEVDSPWDLMWGPDQTLWYSDGAHVFRYDTLVDQKHEIFELPFGSVMGMAVHPDFSDTPWVYMVVDTTDAYYAGGNYAQLRRYTYSATGDSLHSPVRILGWMHPGEHIGARITVGNDRKLYVTTADYQYWYDNDPVGNNSGKVLRVNLDGTRPADNPRADFTWSYGHRNPQGIVCAPNGRIFSSEFGNGNDELNIILRGRDYGWPYFDGDECIFLPDTCNSPTYTYEHAIDVGTNPPSGIDYYESFAIPEFDRSIIEGVVSFNGVIGGIMVYRLNGPQNAVVNKTEYFTGEYGRVRDVCTSPDGKVFFITHDRNNPEIRVLYNPDAHVGLPYQSAGGGLRIYPNPVNDVLTLTAEKDMIGKWELRALAGQVLISGDTFSSQLQVDMKHYSSGIYLLHCGSCVYKIVKE